MKCPRCHTENPETRKFCRECGASLAPVCPACGTENAPGDSYCGECGHDLRQPEEQPGLDYSRPATYTPRFLADKILTSRSSLEGERKLVTVLSTDVVNYTSISERLDLEDVHRIMDGCFGILLDEIHRYEGTVDKFTGDGVVALFGAPVAHEDHVQRACHSALAIREAMRTFGERVGLEFGVEFAVRVGIHSGPVIVGSIGNDLRMEYAAIGDTANLASRMQTTAQPGTIAVSPNVYRTSKEFFRFRQAGRPRGTRKPRHPSVYELVEAGGIQTRFEAAIARGLTRFVGRQKEIAALNEAFERSCSGSGQMVAIVGEAGVGKSRLLLEFLKHLPKETHTYLSGCCMHHGRPIAYLPVLDILRSYLDISEGEPEPLVRRKLRERVTLLGEGLVGELPPLHELLSLKVEDKEYLALGPPQRRERVFEAIRDLLIRESQDRPLIIAVEDAHWIDRTSQEFLDYLVGWLANTHILLIVLYRPEYSHPWAGKSYYSQIGVSQLSAGPSAELVNSILREGKVEAELRQLIISRTGGNPLFMEELTHSLLENGSIEKADDRYVLCRLPSDIAVPETIQGIIAARIDRLENSLKQTMQVASVIGRDFAFRVLQSVTEMRDELKSFLVELQRLELIYEKSLFPELEYVFKHALIQEVTYDSVLLRKRKQLHKKIGEAIERLYPERLEEFYEVLAHHFSRSGDLQKAYEYLRLSGEKASGSYSNWEAFRFFQDAMRVLGSLPPTKDNEKEAVYVRLQAAGAMKVLGYPEDSFEILQEGERLSRKLGDERSIATFCSSLALFHAFKGNPALGLQYAENAFAEADKARDLDLMAPVAFDMCSNYAITGEHEKTISVAPRVIASIEEAGRESDSFGGPFNFSLYTGLSGYCGEALAITGDFQRGEEYCDRALCLAHRIDNPYSIGFAQIMYGFHHLYRGDGAKAVECARKALACAEGGQIVPLTAMALAVSAWGYVLLGEPRLSIEQAGKGLKIQGEARIPFMMSAHYWALGAAHLDLGNMEDARRCTEQGLELAVKNGEKWMAGMLRALLGRILVRAAPSRFRQAQKCAMQGIHTLDDLGLVAFSSVARCLMGELCADAGHKGRAVSYLRQAEAVFLEKGMDYWLRRSQSALEAVSQSHS